MPRPRHRRSPGTPRRARCRCRNWRYSRPGHPGTSPCHIARRESAHNSDRCRRRRSGRTGYNSRCSRIRPRHRPHARRERRWVVPDRRLVGCTPHRRARTDCNSGCSSTHPAGRRSCRTGLAPAHLECRQSPGRLRCDRRRCHRSNRSKSGHSGRSCGHRARPGQDRGLDRVLQDSSGSCRRRQWTSTGCSFYVIRGGSWFRTASELHSSYRIKHTDTDFTFRVARSLTP